jgi:hypothetical protein
MFWMIWGKHGQKDVRQRWVCPRTGSGRGDQQDAHLSATKGPTAEIGGRAGVVAHLAEGIYGRLRNALLNVHLGADEESGAQIIEKRGQGLSGRAYLAIDIPCSSGVLDFRVGPIKKGSQRLF